MKLNVSIVLYKHDFAFVEHLISCLLENESVANIFLIDNSPTASQEFKSLNINKLTYIHAQKNKGYGAGNNIAIRKTILKGIPYHLVLNPDIELKGADLDHLISYMEEHPDVGHLMPKMLNSDGSIQYLCKRLPTPFDLIIRRFLPENWFTKRRDWFEMRDTGYNQIMDVPYLSGSFMLLRTSALKEVGLFDERFFMYPEDIDLTRRIGAKYRTIFYPEVSVIHHHEKASYKSVKLLIIHVWNIMKYFWKWGLRV